MAWLASLLVDLGMNMPNKKQSLMLHFGILHKIETQVCAPRLSHDKIGNGSSKPSSLNRDYNHIISDVVVERT